MGALLYSAFTHQYKSRLKKWASTGTGGRWKEKVGGNQNHLNDARIKSSKTGNQGMRGDGTILNISTSGGQERYGRRIHRKYRSKRVATWYIGSDKERVIVQQRQVARGHKEREYGCRMVREGVTVNQRGRRKLHGVEK